MTVNLEIKGILARLLATEDLIVEHKKVDTACFNVHTRVLTLPLWEKASNVVYDMLVAHEVSHALYSPDMDYSKCGVPHQFVNVVEDARVEKLIKRRYMGLPKTFYTAYKELNDQDFFCLKDEDINSMNLADRVNLYFKIGNFISIEFAEKEKELLNEISESETFDDVLVAAKKLYDYCKSEEKDQKFPELNQSPNNSSSNSGENSQNLELEDSEHENSEEQVEEKHGESNDKVNQQQNKNIKENFLDNNNQNEPEVKTASSFEDSIKNLVSNNIDTTYVEIPKVNLDSVIGKNKDVHDEINNFFDIQQKNFIEGLKENKSTYEYQSVYKESDSSYRNFKNSAKSEVNYLVKEFECRKAADNYSRASVSRTGILDTAKIHSYKFCEDIFKKVSVIPDGKNHGLIFILDWSGSMQNVILDTCKQLYSLIWFCKKVSIPFDVYAFTNEWRRAVYDYSTKQYKPVDLSQHYVEKEPLICINDSFSLMNILTSKVSSKELEKQMINIWRLAFCFYNSYNCKYTYPTRLSLSGTPLNESVISLHQIIPQFKKENKVQKVHCIVLTDGEANVLPYHKEVQRHWESEPRIGVSYMPSNSFLRDRKTGNVYKIDNQYHEYTNVLLKNLKDNYRDVNLIGIRILSNRDASRFISIHCSNEEHHKVSSEWKKNKSFKISNSGYDAYYGISSSNLSQDSDFEVSENATKTEIKSAFAKSLKVKKFNKKILNDFISLVA